MKLVAIALIAAAAGATIMLFPSQSAEERGSQDMPSVHDDALNVELVVEGLTLPTSMRFLDKDNILVLQQGGQVRLIENDRLLIHPVLQLDVPAIAEQGLLGIAIPDDSVDVFLYFTEAEENDLRNRVYRFTYDAGDKVLVDGRMVLDLPALPGPFHNGGKIDIGPDGHLYAVIGDTNAGGGMLDNAVAGREPDDKSVIFRVDRNTGEALEDNPFHSHENEKLHRYFAYGIRNSFGLDFDPVTGRLWMTENGEDEYDEINLVEPGFNSGWHKVMGPMSRSDTTQNDLVLFEGAHFRDPAFSWRDSIGVTDIEFFHSDRFGKRYQDNTFVGNINSGNIFFFQLNSERTGFALDGGLSDAVADDSDEVAAITFGSGFEGITDIETGPDGNLYVLSYLDGRLYRITAE